MAWSFQRVSLGKLSTGKALTTGMKISEQTVHLLTGNGQALLPPARSQSPWVQSSWRSSLQKRRGTEKQLVLVQTVAVTECGLGKRNQNI